MSDPIPVFESRKSPFWTFFAVACLVWIVVGAGAVFAFLRYGKPLLSQAGGGGASSSSAASPFHDALAGAASRQIAEALSKQGGSIQVEPVAGQPNKFKVTNKETGETVVVDMDAVQKLLSANGQGQVQGLDKLFQPPAAASDAPVAPAVSAAAVAPLPDWVPAPDGARVLSNTPLPDAPGNGSFSLSAAAPWADVAHFYEGKLQEAGYAVTRTDAGDGATPGTALVATLGDAVAPQHTIQIAVTQEAGAALTQVQGTYQTAASAPATP